MKQAPITIDDLKSLDLETLEREILDRETALEKLIAEHRKEIDGRKQLLKVVSVLKHGKKPRKPRADKGAKKGPRPTAAPEASSVRFSDRRSGEQRIRAYITENGPQRIEALAKRLAISEASVTAILNTSPHFDCDNDGRWRVA